MGNGQAAPSRAASPELEEITPRSMLLPVMKHDFGAIRDLLKKFGAFRLISDAVEGYTVISFVLLRVIDNIPELLNREKALGKKHDLYLKIKTFLIIYDYCTTHLVDSYFQKIIAKEVAKKFSDPSEQEKMQSFITKLVQNYEYASDIDKWTIKLPGFDSHIVNITIEATGVVKVYAHTDEV